MLRPRSALLRLAVAVTAVSLVASCARREEGAILLTVTLEPTLRAECVQVVAAQTAGNRVASDVVARTAGKNEVRVGIARGSFPETLTWQAIAHTGTCTDESTWKLTSRSEPKSLTFPESGTRPESLRLGAPGEDLDADRDTWVDSNKRGVDCDDGNAAVNPGAMQLCSSTVDTNCNGLLFCNDPSCSADPACNRPATHLSFTTAPQMVLNHECSGAVQLQTVDAQNMPASVQGPTTVTITPSDMAATGLAFFSDANCATPLPMPTFVLGFGSMGTTFSFRTSTAGPLTLQAQAPSFMGATFTTTVAEQPISLLRATPASLALTSGLCSQQPVELEALDSSMRSANAMTALQLTSVIEPAGTPGVDVFTDSACQTMGMPTIAVGASRVTVYVKATRTTPAGMPVTVRWSTPAVPNPASLSLTVAAGAPTRLEFRDMGVSIERAMCSMQDIEVRLLDAQGNRTQAPTGGTTVNLAVAPPTGGGTMSFFTAMGCGSGQVTSSVTIPAGQSAVRLYLNATTNGRYQLTASLGAEMALMEVSVSAMPPTALVFPNAGAPITTQAGTCSRAVRLQTREGPMMTDLLSAVRMNTDVTVQGTPAGRVELFLDMGCMMPLPSGNRLTFLAGQSEVSFYFRGTRADTVTFDAATVPSRLLAEPNPGQPAAVTPGQTRRFAFTTPLAVSATAGPCAPGFGLRALDAFDNPTFATIAAVTPSVAPTLSDGGVVFFSAANCTTPTTTLAMNDGGVTFWVQARVATAYTLNAQSSSPSASTQLLDGGSGAATLTVGPAVPSTVAVTAQPPASMEAGECRSITVERRDAFGNPAPGAAQAYTPSPTVSGVLSVHADMATCMAGVMASGLQFANAATTATFFVRARTVGVTAVLVTSGSAMATTSMVSVTAGVARRLEYDGLPASTSVGTCSQVTVRRRDSENNLTTRPTGLTADVSAMGPAAANLRLGASCPMPPAGTTTSVNLGTSPSGTFGFQPLTPGVLNFTASELSITTPATGMTTVSAGAVDRVQFVVEPSSPQQAGTCIPFELEALDVGMNRVTTATMVPLTTMPGGTFHATATCMAPPVTTVTVPASGTVTFYFRPTMTGMHTVTADPAGAPTGDTATFQVNPGAATTLERMQAFMTNTTAGSCVPFTLHRRDTVGNLTTQGDLTVTVTLSGAASTGLEAAEVFSTPDCMGTGTSPMGMVTIPDTMSSVTFSVRPRVIGPLTMNLASALTDPADTSTTVTPAAVDSLVFTRAPPGSVAVGSCTLVTLAGRDTFGNATALSADIILGMTGNNATFHRQNNCNDPANPTILGSANLTTDFYLRPSAAGVNQTLSATPSATPATQTWTFVSAPVTTLRFQAPAPASVTRLACIGPYRFESTDGTNAVPSGDNRTIALAGAGVQFFSDGACSTPITTIALGSMESQTAQFYFVVFAGTPSATLTGTATPALTTASANVTVVANPGLLTLSVSAPSAALEFKACTSVTVERRVMGSAFSGTFATAVDLSKMGTGSAGLTLHSVPDCSGVEATTATIPAGLSSVVVYAAGRSAERQGAAPFTVATSRVTGVDRFASGFGMDFEDFNVHPAVRRGSCTIANGQTSSTAGSSVACTISPPLPTTTGVRGRTFFTFQTTLPNLDGASQQNVTCELNAGVTALECSRHASSSQTFNIEWQVVSFASGLAVRHIKTNITSAMPRSVTVSLGAHLPANNTFLLVSHKNSSGGLDWDDFPVSDLTGSMAGTVSNLEIRNGSFDFQQPLELNAQVVTWTGATVVSSFFGPSTGASFKGTAPASTETQALLYTARIASTPGSNPLSMCRYRLRGRVVAGVPTFSRGAGAMGHCVDTAIGETVWSRLSFPPTVAVVSEPLNPISIPGGQSVGTWAVGRPLPLDRTWTFIGGQGAGGQAGGESARASNNDDLGTLLARITYTADGAGNTVVNFTRGSTSDNSFFSPFAVVLTP
jgi:hypothetical protein